MLAAACLRPTLLLLSEVEVLWRAHKLLSGFLAAMCSSTRAQKIARQCPCLRCTLFPVLPCGMMSALVYWALTSADGGLNCQTPFMQVSVLCAVHAFLADHAG